MLGKPIKFQPDAVRAAYEAAPGKSRAAKARNAAVSLGCSLGTVARTVKGRTGDALSRSPSGPAPLGLRRATVLAVGHPATVESRTVFPTMVFDVGEEWLLKSGDHSAKIGGRVTKGAWKGFPIYTLTLEERATCPVSCRHWSSCMGNNMPFARRWRPGHDLEWRLRHEVSALEMKHRRGFAVRVHALGDFYSVGYVEMWRELLERHPALHVFGYTARIDPNEDEIAYALALMVRDYWTRCDPPRFAVRFSNAPILARSTVTIESPMQKPRDAVICPAQYAATRSGKKAQNCGSCALCWDTVKRVVFVQH
jgi:Gene product 88